MNREKIFSYFEEGQSVLSPFIDLYFYCLQKTVRFEQLWAIQDPRFRKFLDMADLWLDLLDEREVLKKRDMDELLEIFSEKIETEDDAIIFAYAFLKAVEKNYSFLPQQVNSSRGRYVLFQNERGIVVTKNYPFPSLYEKETTKAMRKMRLRHQYWPTDLASHFQFFHVLPIEWEGRSVSVYSISNLLQAQWERDIHFKIALSQLSIDPEFISYLSEDSSREVPFNIVNDKSGRELFKRICEETEYAFQQDVSVLLFPELLFKAEFEGEFLHFIQEMSRKYQRFIMVIIGYLHDRMDFGIWVNEAKCIVPVLDKSSSGINYEVLCVERKKKPVNFLAKEVGLELISAQAYAQGAIENIYPGDEWSIIETPLGRMGFVICKDFLAISETMLQSLEIDFLFVSALTKTMDGKFMGKAEHIANTTFTGTAVANNGWYVEASGKKSNQHCLGSAPIFAAKGQPYISVYSREPGKWGPLKVFML